MWNSRVKEMTSKGSVGLDPGNGNFCGLGCLVFGFIIYHTCRKQQLPKLTMSLPCLKPCTIFLVVRKKTECMAKYILMSVSGNKALLDPS